MKKLTTIVTIVLLLTVFASNGFAGDVSGTKKSKMNANAIPSLLDGLASDNLGLKTSCAYLLGEYKITKAIIPLMRVLRNDENEEARIAAALALYKIETPMSINAVKQSIRFDESERVSKLASKFYNNYLRNKFSNDVEGNDSTNVAVK